MEQGLRWYKREPRAFLEGVQGLGPDVIGAYAVILDLLYARAGRMPRDDRHLSGILGCSVRKATALTERLIEAGKIAVKDGQIVNFRAETEAKSARNLSETRAKAGRIGGEKSGEARKNNSLAEAHGSSKPQADKSREEHTTTATPRAREAEAPIERAGDPEPEAPKIVALNGGRQDAEALFDRLLDLVTQHSPGGIPPAAWLNPAAQITAAKWLSDLGLSVAEILRIAEAQIRRYGEAPGRPEWWNRPMSEFAGAKAAPPLEPRAPANPFRSSQQGPTVDVAARIARLKQEGRL